VKNSSFDRAQAKDGQPFVLHVKPDSLLDTCGSGDIAIICTEVNKSAPACFALSECHKNTPWNYTAKIVKYDSSRKDSHLLQFANGLEQNKNLGKSGIKVTNTASGEVIEASVLASSKCEGTEVTIEQAPYSFQVVTTRCNLLLDGELVIESDVEDTQAYRKIEDESYVSAIQSLITQKAEPSTADSPPQTEPSTTNASTPVSPPTSTPSSPSHSTNSAPATPSTAPASTSASPAPSKADHKSLPPPPPSQSISASIPAPPQPQPHKPKPRGRPPGSGHHANANGHKRDNDATNTESNKKARVTAASVAAAVPHPASDISSVDLLMHVTSVAGMLKELDAEHSERLQRLEDEVQHLKSRLGNNSSSSPITSPFINRESTPVTARKSFAPITQSPPTFQSKSQKPTDPLQFTPGEFIAVRVDPSSSNDGYWMARVIGGTPKQGLVRVKWFEKYAPLPGWYFMDTREDLVDPLSIFHRNFELVVKPWKNRAGHFIDIFRPVEDLASFDVER